MATMAGQPALRRKRAVMIFVVVLSVWAKPAATGATLSPASNSRPTAISPAPIWAIKPARVITASATGQQHSTVLGLGYVDKAFGAQGFYGPASARANEHTIQRHAYLTHDVRLNGGQGVDVALNYRQHDDRFYYLSYAPSAHQTDALQARLRYRLNNQLALGYEHNREEIDSTSVTGNQHQRNYDSAFVYGHYDAGPVQLAGSLSYLTYDDGDSYSLPVLGLTLPLGAHQLYLNGGKSVRVPTMNDLYLNQAANKGNPLVK